MSKTLFTVGYENTEIDEFVHALRAKKIAIIVDVRKNPVSRKPGFAKSRLAAKLGEANIEYFHLPALGVPTEWRKQAKAEIISRQKMFADYRRRVLPKAGAEISLIQTLMKKSKVALLCYEADASDCHRKFVAEKVTNRDHITDLNILDLTAKLRTTRKIGRS